MNDLSEVLNIVVHYFVWSCLAASAMSGVCNGIHYYLSLKTLSLDAADKFTLIERTVAHGFKTGFATFLISVLVAALTYPLFAHR